MISNFEFLKDKFPILFNLGSLAEKYCYTDSNSCLTKLGMIGETIVNLIVIYDSVLLPEKNNAAIKIKFLHSEGPVSYTHLTLPTIRLTCRSRWSPYH